MVVQIAQATDKAGQIRIASEGLQLDEVCSQYRDVWLDFVSWIWKHGWKCFIMNQAFDAISLNGLQFLTQTYLLQFASSKIMSGHANYFQFLIFC